MDRSAKLRGFYARYVTRLGNVKNPQVEQAFASVRRELFVGPAPWFVRAGSDPKYLPTPDDDPAFLYNDHLIALDPERGINNGQPSLHARCLAALSVQTGQAVLQVGAGTGYYSAILAELVGPAGHVYAFEIDLDLAARAKQNLCDWPWVDLQAHSGTTAALPKVDVIYVNAGLTQPEAAWFEALRPGGQLLFPLQPKYGFGGMLHLQKPRDDAVWSARFICRAGFIPCEDVSQDDETGRRLKAAFDAGNWQKVKSFHLNDAPDETCWFEGSGWWLSTQI